MTPDLALIFIWTGFLTLTCIAAILAFLWAVRSKQFGDQERAGHLPLEAEIPEERKNHRQRENQ